MASMLAGTGPAALSTWQKAHNRVRSTLVTVDAGLK